MNQPTVDQLRTYAADPMTYFAESVIPGIHGDVVLGDVWADFQREAFEVLARCLLAVAAGQKPPCRGLWIERTKGASKDSDVGLALTWLLLFSPRPQLIELGADDQDQILETYKAMKDDLRLNPWKAARLTVQRGKILNENVGSECLFLTTDSTGAHGSRPTVSVCNELCHVQDETFIQTMMDNADKVAGNLTIIATNAGELTTWQHKWRELYRANGRWWFQKVDYPAPWIDEKNVADAQVRNPLGRFNRLWGGMWVPPGGDALASESIRRATKHKTPLDRRDPEQFNGGGIGLDIGLTNHHAAMVVVVSDYHNQKIRVAYVRDFPPPVNLEDVVVAVRDARWRFAVTFLAYDPYEMARISQELAAEGFHIEPCRPTPQVLTRQSAVMRDVFREGTIELYSDDDGDGDLLIEDLYSTRVVERGYGERLEWPENENGHCDRAAALANVLPFAVEGLAVAPPELYDDGLGNNILTAMGVKL